MNARLIGRCTVWGLAFFLCLDATAQSRVRPEPRYAFTGSADQNEGRRILGEFRRLGLAGDYALDFTLRVMPRRGDERIVAGRLYGTRNDTGPLTLVEFPAGTEGARRVLVQNGPQSSVWTVPADNVDAVAVGAAQLFAPLGGTDLTAFDLQMPFLFWDDVVFEGVVSMRGRPAHRFLAYPPAEIAAARPGLAGVRFYLDTQFSALVEAEILGPDQTPVKTISVLDLKRTQDQWIVRTIDLRDEATRNKTRFRVNAAALSLSLPRIVFTPAHLPLPPSLDSSLHFESFK
ncbi:MAG TPA: outer membrane lipoprotein-sorting protein [Opitutaceae bacterium]|nr:outer membrane lipoprotein-sorting protein [Opitutaceae bacterium]